MQNTVYPRPVQPGDKVGLVLPSSMIDTDTLAKATVYVQELGLTPVVGTEAERVTKLFTAHQAGTIDELLQHADADMVRDYRHFVASGYMAGDPQLRARDINRFFADGSIAAIWCLRGGYSSAQLMPYLDYDIIRSHPKQILGYSDVTNVINGIYRNTGTITYHAPMVTPNFVNAKFLDDAGQPDAYTLDYFRRFILSDWDTVEIENYRDEPRRTIHPGNAEGAIVGGNLFEIASAVGTSYLPPAAGNIVFLEETDTHIVLADMALTTLKNSGFFDGCAGVILGEFIGQKNVTGGGKFQDWLMGPLLANCFGDASFPVLAGVTIGHGQHTATFPIGAKCHLDAGQQTITVMR